MSTQILKYFTSRLFPTWLLTWAAGPWARFRVDLAQTSFFTGRQFRIFKELSLTSGTPYVIRVARPTCNAVLLGLTLDAYNGQIRLEMVRGGTEGGTWEPVPEVFPVNEMTANTKPDVYNTQLVISSGGTHTGGTLWDFIELAAATNPQQGSTIGGAVPDERGVPMASVGYYRFTTNSVGTIRGKFALRWEDR